MGTIHPLWNILKKNRAGERAGLFAVCSANEMVLRAAIRRAVQGKYPLIIESTSNQVNQEGGYTGMKPHAFAEMVRRIALEEGMPEETLILGGDHLGPLVWRNEAEDAAMEKAAAMVRAYTLAGFTKIHLDTSMRLASDKVPEDRFHGGLDPQVCARRGAALAKIVDEAFAEYAEQKTGVLQPLLVIGSEVPNPGGTQGHEDLVSPTKSGDFLQQVAVFRTAFQTEGVSFDKVAAFVVQPGVEFGDDFVCPYNREAAASLTGALKTVPSLVFEGHSTDYQVVEKLSQMVEDGVAILKVGPALTFTLREGLLLLEEIENILIKEQGRRSGFKEVLLDEMNSQDMYWKSYYTGRAEQIEYKKLYSYSDRCRYYLPLERVQRAVETLLSNLPEIPPALISQYFPAQYRRYAQGLLRNDAPSVLYDRIGDLCDQYARACGLSP